MTLGGTFDHLHKGHKKLLDTAFSLGQKVTVAITANDFFHQKEIAEVISPYDARRHELIEYLKEKNVVKRARITPLHDIYGIARDDETLDSIIVTRETYPNAVKINKLRSTNTLSQLTIITVPYVKSSDRRIMSSTRIRNGEINRNGDVYARIFKKNLLHLPKYLRHTLRKPIGKLITRNPNNTNLLEYIQKQKPVMVITVGDIITQSLHKVRYFPAVSIIDYKSRRKSLTAPKSALKAGTPNRPGTLNYRSVQVLRNAIKKFLYYRKARRVVIRGEEDLLALPAILFSPLGSLVLYGLLDQGVVAVPVSEEKKEEVIKILKQFE